MPPHIIPFSPHLSPAMRSRLIVQVSKIIFCTLTVLEALSVVILGLIRITVNKDLHLIPYLLILAAACSFVVYFAIDGVLEENAYTLINFGLSVVFLWINALLAFIFPSSGDGTRDYVTVSRFVIVMAVSPLQLIMAATVWRCFGWKRTMTVGLDPKLIQLYYDYQKYTTSLRLDFQYTVILLLLYGVYMLGDEYFLNWELYVCLLLIGISFLIALLGHRCVIRESNEYTLAFIILEWPIFFYLVGRGISFAVIDPPHMHPSLEENLYMLAFILGAVGIVNRFILGRFLYKCWKNFGFGLRDRVFDRQNPFDETKSLLNNTMRTDGSES